MGPAPGPPRLHRCPGKGVPEGPSLRALCPDLDGSEELPRGTEGESVESEVP